MRTARIVVTGGRGFLGRHIVRACRAAGLDARSCSRSEGVDVRDGEALGLFLKAVAPDWVIHCAAHVGGIGYVASHAIQVFQDNLAISSGLMHGVHTAGVRRLITVMPNCTYPGDKDVYREEEWWDGPVHDSVLMYALPRKTLWGLCRTYGEVSGLQTAHLILPNLYGPGDVMDPIRSHALGALVRKIVDAERTGAKEVEVWGTGRPVREWLFVEDAAEAVVRFLGLASAGDPSMHGHPLYNVGVGKGISVAALAELIGDIVGWNGALNFNSNRPEGAAVKVLDGSKFQSLTGWSPRTELGEGIRQTVAWYGARAEGEVAHAH